MFVPQSVNLYHLSSPIVHERTFAPREEKIWDVPLRYYAAQHLATMNDEELDNDWKLNDFFGTIVVINLPSATERLRKITEELAQIGTTDFKVFTAIDGRLELEPEIWTKFHKNRDRIDPSTEEGIQALHRFQQGEAGCYMSHFKVIQNIKKAFDEAMKELAHAQANNDKKAIRKAKKKVRQYSRVLILEDDGGFGIVDPTGLSVNRKGVGRLLRKAIQNLPDHWDMLYFIAQAIEPTQEISCRLRKIKGSFCTLAYAINYSMYETLVEVLEKVEDPEVTDVWPVDHEISNIHYLFNVYAVFPSIAFHQAGPSQISSKEMRRLWQGQPVLPSSFE